MTGIRKAKQEEYKEQAKQPALTLLAMIGPPLINNFMSPVAENMNNLTVHAFTASKAYSLLTKQDWGGLVNLCYQATFDHMTGFLFMINLSFMYIFGSWLEKKLWGWRYFAFLTLAVFVPWAILFYDVKSAPSLVEKMFVSPMLMLLFMAGGYAAVKPEKPFVPADWVRPSWKIFRQERKVPLMEMYWVSPWVFIIVLIVYASLVNVGMSVNRRMILDLPGSSPMMAQAHRWLIGRIDQPDQIAAFSWLAAIGTLAAGAVSAPTLLMIRMTTQAKRSGGVLQQRALQHYKELRSLDMTHDQALEGTSKFLAVPLDICRDWIAKGQAALKQEKRN
ncbi:MAG: hypothetical protein U0105_08410 [Candidatus Obscuribacterales bacterium]